MTQAHDVLAIDKIRRDGGTQPRAELNREVVEDYAARFGEGVEFPPVVVFFDGIHYWLADGFHRVEAMVTLGVKSINADVRQGTREDAVWFSCGANKTHGLHRSNADKRRAVETALRLRPQHSDRSIAEHCGVSHNFVGELRRAAGLSSDDKVTAKDGSERPVARDARAAAGKASAAKRAERKGGAEAPSEPQPRAKAAPTRIVREGAQEEYSEDAPGARTGPVFHCPTCHERLPRGGLVHCPRCDEHVPGSTAECPNCDGNIRGAVQVVLGEPPAKARPAEEVPPVPLDELAVLSEARGGITDQLGQLLPEKLRPVFAVAPKQLNEARGFIKQAMRVLAGLGDALRGAGASPELAHPLAPVLALGEKLDDVENALAAALPYAVCPYCKGAGAGCTGCASAGWVGSSRVDLQACKLEYSIVSPK